MLSGTVIISDDRAHALDDSACRKIQESLEFVVDPENHYITLRICSQKSVQCRDQHRRKCQI